MRMAVVVPAYNEAETLGACLAAIQQAIAQLPPAVPEVKVLVVLDSCDDQSVEIVQQAGIDYLCCEVRCVGKARDLGVRAMIAEGAEWIACTDADTLVDEQWLSAQYAHQPAALICGVVEIKDWSPLSAAARQKYLRHYQDKMDHRHVHGANLSFSAAAYLKAGGFQASSCHEDVQLVEQMQCLNLHIVWSNQVRVTTSSRLDSRVSDGFAAYLNRLEQACRAASDV